MNDSISDLTESRRETLSVRSSDDNAHETAFTWPASTPYAKDDVEQISSIESRKENSSNAEDYCQSQIVVFNQMRSFSAQLMVHPLAQLPLSFMCITQFFSG